MFVSERGQFALGAMMSGAMLCWTVTATHAQAQEAPAAKFDVRAIQIKGNTLLAAGEVEDIVYPFMGPGKTPNDIEAARAALQAAFETRGYATVSVVIPEQSVDSGVILLEVQPQTIGTVSVAGGKRTSRDWVMQRAPSLVPGAAPNFTAVQHDVVALNRSADRKVTPEVKAGVAPGTVDVVLNVEDKLPLHGSLELNNFGSAATTDLRAAATLRYDDLWGRGDSISVSAQLPPRRTKDGTVVSGNYLAHVGNVQLLAYGVYSNSDIAVVGGTSVVGKGTIFGMRGIVPLGQEAGFYHALTIGVDRKDFRENVKLGADTDSAPINYYPVTIGWRGDWSEEKAQSHVGFTTVFGVRGLGDGGKQFDYKRTGAKPDFFVFKSDLGHTRTFANDIQFDARLTGQWSADPLVSNEGFSLGGMETVRGYFESEALGDWGVADQTELRSPDIARLIGVKPLDTLRGLVFFDAGVAGIYRPLAGQKSRFNLATAGVGARLKAFGHINGTIDLGVPIISGPDKSAGDFFARFRIWGEF